MNNSYKISLEDIFLNEILANIINVSKNFINIKDLFFVNKFIYQNISKYGLLNNWIHNNIFKINDNLKYPKYIQKEICNYRTSNKFK